MTDALAPLVQQKRSRPGNDLISELATATVEGERLTDAEVISFLCLLVLAGAETTYHLLGSALLAMLRDPALLASVRADRSRIASRARGDAALGVADPDRHAAWRWRTSRSRARGSRAAATSCSASAPPTATRPTSPTRTASTSIGRATAHLAFGLGRHYCAGSRLAILEATVAIDALLDRFADLRLDPRSKPPARHGSRVPRPGAPAEFAYPEPR